MQRDNSSRAIRRIALHRDDLGRMFCAMMPMTAPQFPTRLLGGLGNPEGGENQPSLLRPTNQ